MVTVVSKLKGKASAGFDEMLWFPNVIMCQVYKKPLSFIFNESINQSVFPDLLKIAKIRPVCRKEVIDKDKYKYRPIFVLSVF
jgi:hypothetical protein